MKLGERKKEEESDSNTSFFVVAVVEEFKECSVDDVVYNHFPVHQQRDIKQQTTNKNTHFSSKGRMASLRCFMTDALSSGFSFNSSARLSGTGSSLKRENWGP